MQGDNNSIHFLNQFLHPLAAFGVFSQRNGDITTAIVLNQSAVGMIAAPGA